MDKRSLNERDVCTKFILPAVEASLTVTTTAAIRRRLLDALLAEALAPALNLELKAAE